jgi:hypothetical protein
MSISPALDNLVAGHIVAGHFFAGHFAAGLFQWDLQVFTVHDEMTPRQNNPATKFLKKKSKHKKILFL